MRSSWVASDSQDLNGPRISLLAGRTGTRENIGRPQVRWADGVELATQVLQSRTISQRSSNALTIGTIIRETVNASRDFVVQHFSNPDRG